MDEVFEEAESSVDPVTSALVFSYSVTFVKERYSPKTRETKNEENAKPRTMSHVILICMQ